MGANPDAGNAYSRTRSRELWDSLEKVIRICNEEKTDLLLIAGDLFHRQPLLRELKEVSAMISTLEDTSVVIIAGNHDYIKRDSHYRSFPWPDRVTFLTDEEMSCAEYPQLKTAVYGFSYHSREIKESRYDHAAAPGRYRYEILLAHGGDEKHIPIHRENLTRLGYDYIALGHIHKPGQLKGVKAAYAGALEPIDRNDTGPHGYIRGEMTAEGCRIEFVPLALRSYLQLEISVNARMSGYDLKTAVRRAVEESGVQNLYQILLLGYRDPEVRFDTSGMDVYGNILEIRDETCPAYDFERLLAKNRENLLGRYIESFEKFNRDSLEYEALCEGVQALMETRVNEGTSRI